MRATHFNFLVSWINGKDWRIWCKEYLTVDDDIFLCNSFYFFKINLQSNSNTKCKGQKICTRYIQIILNNVFFPELMELRDTVSQIKTL